MCIRDRLVPVQADYLAAEGMTELVGTVRSVQRQINPRLKIGGVFLTCLLYTSRCV